MKQLTILILCLASVVSQAQQSIPAIRGEINTYFPSTNNKSIQAIRLRETLNDVLDHVDTLNKKRFAKTIAETRLINNTNYEMVYIVDSGKEGWLKYVSGSGAVDDNTNTIVAANGRRYIREVVRATTVADGFVTNSKLANAPANTLKGNNTGSSASVQDLTISQVKTMLAVENVSNTADANKPISTATQTALNSKHPNMTIVDENTALGSPGQIVRMKFVGDGITSTRSVDTVTVTVPISQSPMQWRDEGSNVGASGEITTYNIVGSTAEISNSGSTATLTITEPVSFVAAASDEVTPIGTGTKVTFRMPHTMTLTGVRASLTTAQASGSLITVDVRENGTTVLSTLITLDNTERTTTTAATLPVVSDSAIADDSEMTIVVTQVGAATVATGLKITLLGTR